MVWADMHVSGAQRHDPSPSCHSDHVGPFLINNKTYQPLTPFAAKLQAQSTVPAPKALPTSSAPTTRRPLLSMLSLTRPSILKEPTRHFDPSREPKLHGLP